MKSIAALAVASAACVTMAAQVGETFDQAYARLEAGRAYQRQPTGRVAMPTTIDGITLDNVVEIPADYDPARPLPLRVSLHGGVGREAPGFGDLPARPLSNRTPAGREIVIHPRAWSGSAWWRPLQVDNVLRLVERVKRDYNVDESRIYITGVSDGGSGVYFFGMREATLWSACLPINGHPLVIANPDTGADGQLHAGNLVNCPLYIVNGGKDPLYPAASVSPLVDMFRRASVPLVFQVHPDAGHNVAWWPQERPRYEAFLAAHPRVAHPERISWETERTDRYNRFRWVMIDRLGKRGSDVRLQDVNTYRRMPIGELDLFDRSKASGRVDAERKGNAFDVKTRGVHQLTLLLSPEVVDFSRPVVVRVNGRPVHDAIVEPDVATLAKWAARDNDRTMLYGAALAITVP
jgi:pimeloyl-ACP methyl ester carboxylesterase